MEATAIEAVHVTAVLTDCSRWLFSAPTLSRLSETGFFFNTFTFCSFY